MDSAIRAYNYGFITEEALIENIIGNNGIIPRVGYNIVGDRMNIVFRVEFTGDMLNEVFPGTDKTYKQLFIEGVEGYWSGSLDELGIYMDMNVVEFDSSFCEVETINMISFERAVEERKPGKKNDGYISKYRGQIIDIVDFDYHKDQRVNRFTDTGRFQYICAHESGHAFGLCDLHDKGFYNPNVDSIMWGKVNYGVEDNTLDLRMLYEALTVGGPIEYSDKPQILDRYAPGWERR